MKRIFNIESVLLAVLIGFTGLSPWVQAQETRLIEIKPQPLTTALNNFSRRTGLQFAYVSTVAEGIDSQGTEGAESPEAALDSILVGTGLTYRFLNNETIAIVAPERAGAGRNQGNTLLASTQVLMAQAQTPATPNQVNQPASQQANANDSTSRPLREVVVTGTRIARTGTDTPTPVTVLDSQSIELSGDVRVAAMLNELPAIRATQTLGNVNDNPKEAGTNFLNLRGLGIDRTLVLVNGRRHVGSRVGSAAVDINTIPTALIDRIEVITGGASAIYGADAVSGVVNIILKDDFEGLRFDGQVGGAEAGDAETYQFSVTGGTNTGDGRGNVYFNASWDESNRARASNRGWSSQNLRFAPNPDDTGPDDGIPDQILFDNTGFIGTPAGGQVVGPNGELFRSQGGPFTFDKSGNLVPQDEGTLVLPFLSQGGDFVDLSQFDLLAVPLERKILSGGLKYRLTDSVEFFAEGTFAQTESETDGQPTFNLGFDSSATGIPGAFIQRDNPFVPQSLRDILDSNSLSGFFVGRTNVDQGGRRSKSNRDTLQFYTGLRGDLADNIEFKIHYQWGQTDNTTEFINERVNSRFLQQIDVVTGAGGEPVCRDPSNGCVPLNILGPQAATAEALEFSQVDFVTKGQLTQEVVSGHVTGDTGDFLELPGGPMGFAVGAEYRQEKSVTEEGFLRNTGAIFATAPVDDTDGEFDVVEGFAEINMPLIRDMTFVQELNLDAAVRVADYSTIGSTTTWKIGGDWLPNNSIRFRGTVSEAVRAPNIGELFAAVEQSNRFINDPCDVDFINAGSANRAGNCAALGVPSGFQSNSEAVTKAVFSGGNSDLNEEKADTFTVGAIFTPGFINDLSLTVDYWNIDIQSAINSFPPQAVVNGCVDASNTDNPLCSAVTRDAGGNISTVSSQLINIAALETSGVDIEGRYRLYLDNGGELGFNLVATYLLERDFFAQEGQSRPDSEAEEFGDPEFQLNFRTTYRWNDLTLSLRERFFSSQKFDVAEDSELRDPSSTGDEWYTDIQARYNIGESVGVGNSIGLYLGIKNVFDNAPPLLARVPETRSFGDDAIIFDQLGRFFYAGMRYNFNR